jgi:hypothetical protein
MAGHQAANASRADDIQPVPLRAMGSIDNLAIDSKTLEDQQLEVTKNADRIAYGHSDEDAEFLANFDEAKKKKMYRKIDWRLIPMLALLYLISCMSREEVEWVALTSQTLTARILAMPASRVSSKT